MRTGRSGESPRLYADYSELRGLSEGPTVADAIRRFCDPFPDELIVSGGGVRNATLMELLRQPLGAIPVTPIDALGIPSEAKEAVAFALLGAATLDNEPSNIPAATGAKHAAVLGSVTPRPLSLPRI